MPEMSDRDALKRIHHLVNHEVTRSCGWLTLRYVDLEAMFKVIQLAELGLHFQELKPLPGCGGDNLSD